MYLHNSSFALSGIGIACSNHGLHRTAGLAQFQKLIGVVTIKDDATAAMEQPNQVAGTTPD
jgi:hypothetical protein